MRILFLHNNFPAQFGHVGAFLAKQGWDVVWGTAREGAFTSYQGGRIVRYKPHREPSKETHPYAVSWERAVLHGQAVARAGLKLKQSGFSPDLVVAHTGWGPGLYVKEIWPDTKFIGYFEWYYSREAPDVAYLNPDKTRDFSDADLSSRSRNAQILMDLANSEIGLVPTAFQKSTFPRKFDDVLHVQHDGIDTDAHRPRAADAPRGLILPNLDLSGADEIITYVARGMEPYRGFTQFMAALEQIQKRRPNAHAVIVGEDRVAYGAQPKDGKSFKTRALEEHDLDLARTHFTGLLPRDQYQEVLRASSVHVYLTVPFVLSWSMMEAMATGCLLVASDTPPVREYLEHGRNGLLVDFHDRDAQVETICDALDRQADHAPLRVAARETILDGLSFDDILPAKQRLFETVANG
ncbi:MAG: glycosyltransferase [Pseudomonadota bacterium]